MSLSSLIPELEAALQHGSAEKHGEMLRQITTLFLQGSDHFNEDHICLFDDVFGRLVEEIESRARAELSRRLAPVPNAPLNILRRLAKDDDIVVAAPVLTQSPRLQEQDLVDVARSMGQAHLLALSGRAHLQPALADVLVQRGDRDVVHGVAANPGAELSDTGYSSLVKRAEKDGALAEAVAQRPDIPGHLFRELLMRATDVVQRRLLSSAKPETQAEIRRVLATVSGQVAATMRPRRDFSEAEESIRKAVADGILDEKMLAGFATASRYEHTVVALAELCQVPPDVAEKMMKGDRPDPVLILCKAAGFAWPTARAILLARPGNRGKSGPALAQAMVNFDRLLASTAQRVVRFWQASHNTPAA